MARVKVKFVCGCGAQFTNPLEAELHADQMHHTLDAQGTIEPDNKDKPKGD